MTQESQLIWLEKSHTRWRHNMDINMETAQKIADLGNACMDLEETINDMMDDGEITHMMLLDALAIHGYTIEKATGENIASMAYMYGLSLEAEKV